MKKILCLVSLSFFFFTCPVQAETYDSSWGLFIILDHCGDDYYCIVKTVDAYTLDGLVPLLKRALKGQSSYPINTTKKGSLTKENLKFMTYTERYRDRNVECIIRVVYDPETLQVKRVRLSGDCASSKAPPMPASVTFEK